MAAPLFRLLERNSCFEWTVACNEAFECLRSCLVSDPIVAFPDLNPEAKPFQLATDASDLASYQTLARVVPGSRITRKRWRESGIIPPTVYAVR